MPSGGCVGGNSARVDSEHVRCRVVSSFERVFDAEPLPTDPRRRLPPHGDVPLPGADGVHPEGPQWVNPKNPLEDQDLRVSADVPLDKPNVSYLGYIPREIRQNADFAAPRGQPRDLGQRGIIAA